MKGAAKPPYPFLVTGVFTGPLNVLHAGPGAGDRSRFTTLSKSPDEHLVLVDLVGLAELTDPGLHLLPQGVVGLVSIQQALGFLEDYRACG